jgi:[ribosomal protein S18]-alanine N-acetyltransferase
MNTSGKFQLESVISEDIILMDKELFPNPWSSQQWLEADPNHRFLYSLRNEKGLAGFCLINIIPGDETAHLYKIITNPEYRGSGLAQFFWTEVINDLKFRNIKSVYLEVESTNIAAITFYQKSGFKLLRRNKAYYSNGEDAMIMILTL